MSADSWRSEFYPVDAETVAKHGDAVKAVEHSLQKWRGALPKNLKKHGLSCAPLAFIADTCSLCKMYISGRCCRACPLYVSRGEVACTDERSDELINPYDSYVLGHNPKPMIEALELALDWARKNGGRGDE